MPEIANKLHHVLSFNGRGSHVAITEDPFEDPTSFTICLWAKPQVIDDSSWHGLIGKQGDTYRKPGLWLCPASGGLYYDSYSPAGQRFGEQLDDFFTKDEWTHIAWVKRGTQYKIYRLPIYLVWMLSAMGSSCVRTAPTSSSAYSSSEETTARCRSDRV